MISSQRRAHFVIWRVLAPLALIGLIIAIGARPPRPVQLSPDGATTPARPGSSP